MPTCEGTQRRFTEAAREAAALARKRKREHRALYPEEHQLVLVVVRAVDTPRAFAWQIRRFGHMEPVKLSLSTFADPGDAARSGQAVLERMRDAMATAGTR